MKRTAILSAGAALLMSASAVLAADPVIWQPEPAMDAEPPVAERYDWSGFYGGVHAGYSWGRTDAIDLPNAFGFPWQTAFGQFGADTGGFVGGIQAGVNWQQDVFVWGLEGDLGWLATRGSAPYEDTITFGRRPSDLFTDGGPYATLRGRVGVAADTLLIFATGGLMAADLNSWVAARDGLLVTDKTGWQLGWTIGAGAELALDRNWTVKLDYLYYDLGTDRVSGNVGPTVHSFDIGHTGHMARVGINYRF